MKYRVEIFQDNNWIKWSTHKNEENAIFNAEVIHKSRKINVRIIHEGKIIMALYINPKKSKRRIVAHEEV